MIRFCRGHWQLLLITALLYIFWNTPVAAPVWMLVVFFHEGAHGLAAILTGGIIEELVLDPRQGGSLTSRGGNFFAIASAGYLGSLLIGVVYFALALRTDWDRLLLALCGGISLMIAALYVRDGFSVAFAVVTGLVLIGIAWKLPATISDLVLRIIGLASILYVPYDIFSDTFRQSGGSDAAMLAAEFGGSERFWGGLWLIISLIWIGLCFRFVLGPDSNLHFARTGPGRRH